MKQLGYYGTSGGYSAFGATDSGGGGVSASSTLEDKTSILNQVTSWVSGAVDSISDLSGELYDKATNMVQEGTNEVEYKLKQVHNQMIEAIRNEEKISNALAKMPDGVEKNRIIKEYQDSQSYFSTYVLPAYQKLAPMVGLSTNPYEIENEKPKIPSSLGLEPITTTAIAIAIAVVALSGVVVYYINQQNRILEDPELRKYASQTGLAAITGNLKWPLIIIGIGVAATGIARLIRK